MWNWNRSYMKLISDMKISYLKLHNLKLISHVKTSDMKFDMKFHMLQFELRVSHARLCVSHVKIQM